MRKRTDEELAARFTELRESDERQSPPFEAMYRQGVDSAARRRTGLPTRWVTAAAVAFIAVAGSWGYLRSSRESVAPIAPLSQWRSPTAFLLQGPGDALLRTVPVLAAPAELEHLRATHVHQEDR